MHSIREELNGVDFDWEQPATNDEYLSYMHLIAEAAMELHKRNFKVSVALHAMRSMGSTTLGRCQPM